MLIFSITLACECVKVSAAGLYARSTKEEMNGSGIQINFIKIWHLRCRHWKHVWQLSGPLLH